MQLAKSQIYVRLYILSKKINTCYWPNLGYMSNFRL